MKHTEKKYEKIFQKVMRSECRKFYKKLRKQTKHTGKRYINYHHHLPMSKIIADNFYKKRKWPLRTTARANSNLNRIIKQHHPYHETTPHH